MTKKISTFVRQLVLEAGLALLMLYFIFLAVDILEPGSISLFIDPTNLLYGAVASIAVLMLVTKFSAPQHILPKSVTATSWIVTLVSSLLLGWFTAWQIREFTSHELLIGVCTGLLIFLLPSVLAPGDPEEIK